MANPIIRGFGGIGRFSGRDSRGEFWPYVGAVIALVFIVQAMGTGVVMADMMSKVQAHIDAQPVLVVPEDLRPDTPIRI